MTCPDCGSMTSVVKTDRLTPDAPTRRLRQCPCGYRGVSREEWERRVPPATHRQPLGNQVPLPVDMHSGANPPATAPQLPGNGMPPPVATGNPPATAGGFGGALPSDLPSGSDPGPISAASPERGRARSKYPAEFEAAWTATAQTGSKHRAFLAWKRQGKPAAAAIATLWAKWAATDQYRRGIVPHVSTWMNGRCFEQEPVEAPRAAPAPGARCSYHRLPNTRGKAARAPLASCPECKHAGAAQRGRESEPTPAAAIVPATREQLATLRKPKTISAVIRAADGTETPVDLEATG